jgi:hypothetical protein
VEEGDDDERVAMIRYTNDYVIDAVNCVLSPPLCSTVTFTSQPSNFTHHLIPHSPRLPTPLTPRHSSRRPLPTHASSRPSSPMAYPSTRPMYPNPFLLRNMVIPLRRRQSIRRSSCSIRKRVWSETSSVDEEIGGEEG